MHRDPAPQPAAGTGEAELHDPLVGLHRQLVEVCPVCRDQWELLGRERERFLARLAAEKRGPATRRTAGADDADPAAAEPDHHRTTWSWEARRLEDRLRRLRRHRAAAVKQARELLDRGPEGRRETLDRSQRRFRSRLLAERLLDRGREVLATDPREAADLLALVPRVVAGVAGSEEQTWAAELAARAAGGRAEALRRAGDPEAADRVFTALRNGLDCRPVEDPAVHAELAHLEARLRADQGRAGEAGRLLDTAAVLFLHAGLPERAAHAHVDHARLLRPSAPEEAWDRLQAARRTLEAAPPGSPADGDPRLPLVLACLELAVLCARGRFEQARRHRDRCAPLLADPDDPQAAAFTTWLRWRLPAEPAEGNPTPAEAGHHSEPPLPETSPPRLPGVSEDG